MWFIFCSSGLKTAGGVLFLVLVTCFLALLSVNSDMIIFHYLFAGFNCVQVRPPSPSETVWANDCLVSWPPLSLLVQPQGPFVFFFRIVFNKEARNAMKYCCSRKRPDHMIKSKASVSPSLQTLRKTLFGLTLLGHVTPLETVKGNHTHIHQTNEIWCYIVVMMWDLQILKLSAGNFLDFFKPPRWPAGFGPCQHYFILSARPAYASSIVICFHCHGAMAAEGLKGLLDTSYT